MIQDGVREFDGYEFTTRRPPSDRRTMRACIARKSRQRRSLTLRPIQATDRETGGFHHPRASRQRVQKHAAVGFDEHARVEDHDDAAVGLGADQPAEALLQLDDGFGKLILVERAAAPGCG